MGDNCVMGREAEEHSTHCSEPSRVSMQGIRNQTGLGVTAAAGAAGLMDVVA